LLASRTLSALILAAASLTACAPDDDANDSNPYQPLPYDAGLTQDASPIVATGGGGMQQPPASSGDAGVVTPRMDAGMNPPVVMPMGDAGVVMSMGDTGVVMPMGDAGVTPDAGGMARPDQGMGDGKDVVCIGDSWMHLSGMSGIQDSLLRISKRPFRVFGVPGTELLMANAAGPAITSQYDDAKKGGPIKTVVMTGGGNDILQEKLLPCIDDNFDNDNVCPMQIDAVAARLQQLWAQMAKDGVTDVLIIGYSSKTNPLGLGTTKKSIAYSNMKIPPLCDMVPAPLRCTTFDTDMLVPDLTIRSSDGIHPDDPSYDKIGAAVWKVMQDKGMRR
jgi:hypothetical protein